MNGPGAQSAVRSPRRRLPGAVRDRLLPLGIVLAVIGCLVGGALASGARLFVVETASMGRAAPVGTLIVDLPVAFRDLAVGDVITYAPKQAEGITITHRVVETSGASLRTRGDLNAARDPWRVTASEVIGRAALTVPGVGWLLRAMPLLLLGAAVVIVVTSFLPSATWRAGGRLMGGSAVVAVVLSVLKPLTNYQVIATSASAAGVRAEVVSTGLLPLRLSSGPRAIELAPGEAGRLLVLADERGRYVVSSVLGLDPVGWALVAVVLLLPTLWVLLVGLPVGPAIAGEQA